MSQSPQNPLRIVEEPLRREKPRGDKVLAYSFLASVLLNFGWMFWVGQSAVFSSTRAFTELHLKPLKIYKPVLVKPAPKPPKILTPPPPPVMPKIRQTVQPLRPVVHLPRLTPRIARTLPARTRLAPVQSAPLPSAPLPSAQLPPAQSRLVQPRHEIRMAMNEPETTQLARHDFMPPGIKTPTSFGRGLIQPEARQPAVQPSEVKPAEIRQPEVKQPEIKSAEVKQPETRQPETRQPAVKQAEYKRPGWTAVEIQGATNLTDYASPEVSDDDGVAGKTVVITWTVNEKGRAVNPHVTQSSGNRAVDQKCVDSIRSMRFQPAIQDHYFQEALMNRKFGF